MKLRVLVIGAALAFAPLGLAADDDAQDEQQIRSKGKYVNLLPKVTVVDPTAEKTLQNADDSDLDPELRAILEEAGRAENE